ncbi:hypothetical protein ACJMK2_016556 [Sinanodonta woodiana]|uniref:Uncharacterized protein n=1 Tax=Sinanodonta woodiana TaxID=1069815 RepID=A0ABD3UU07_SINWO
MPLLYPIGYVKSSTTCYDNGYTAYCQYGCCGSNGYQYCCNNSLNNSSPAHDGRLVLGLTLGSVTGFPVLMCIIICCCKHCHHSGSSTSGQVLQPPTNMAFSISSVATMNGTTMQMTQLISGTYAPSYPTFPQMAGGYLSVNAAMNYPYGAPQSPNNSCAAPPPDLDKRFNVIVM